MSLIIAKPGIPDLPVNSVGETGLGGIIAVDDGGLTVAAGITLADLITLAQQTGQLKALADIIDIDPADIKMKMESDADLNTDPVSKMGECMPTLAELMMCEFTQRHTAANYQRALSLFQLTSCGIPRSCAIFYAKSTRVQTFSFFVAEVNKPQQMGDKRTTFKTKYQITGVVPDWPLT